MNTPTNQEQALAPDSGAETAATDSSADIHVASRDALPEHAQNSRAEESADPAFGIMLSDAKRSTNVFSETVAVAADASLDKRAETPTEPGAEATLQGTDTDSPANEPRDVPMDGSMGTPEVPSAELNFATPNSVLDVPTGFSHAPGVNVA